MRLVLDASAAVNALVPSPLRDATRRRLVDAELFAPTLIDTEVLSALARLERTGAITAQEAQSALTAWRRLPCARVDTQPVMDDIWALRHAIRISDAHYIVVAHVLDVALLTADQRLTRAPLRDVAVLTIGSSA